MFPRYIEDKWSYSFHKRCVFIHFIVNLCRNLSYTSEIETLLFRKWVLPPYLFKTVDFKFFIAVEDLFVEVVEIPFDLRALMGLWILILKPSFFRHYSLFLFKKVVHPKLNKTLNHFRIMLMRTREFQPPLEKRYLI